MIIDNIYILFGNTIYKKAVGILMGTSCVPLVADLFLYSYESQFMATLFKDTSKHDLLRELNNTF